MATTCAHGIAFGDDVAFVDECQRCDWCPRCESIREYDGETCKACGYVWGEGDA